MPISYPVWLLNAFKFTVLNNANLVPSVIINAPGMGVGEGAGRKDISSFSRCSTGAHKTLELSGEFQIQRAKQMDKIDLGPTEVYFAVKTFNKHMPSVCTLFKRVLRVRVYVGTAEPIFNLGGRGGGLKMSADAASL